MGVQKGNADSVREVLYGSYCGGAKPGMRAVKKGNWKLIKYESSRDGVNETQLFNLADNPGELLIQHHAPAVSALTGFKATKQQVNLAKDPQFADKLKEMEGLLLAEMRHHDAPYRFSNQPDDGLTPPVIRDPQKKKPKDKKKPKR